SPILRLPHLHHLYIHPLFTLHAYLHPRALHSFPTRRSSDLMFALRRQDTGGDFLSLEQHRVVAIACALRTQEGLKLWSLGETGTDRKSTRLNSSHVKISYAVFCLKKKKSSR